MNFCAVPHPVRVLALFAGLALLPLGRAEWSTGDATDQVHILAEMEVHGGEVAHSALSALTARRASPNLKSVIEGEQLQQFNDLGAGDAIRRLPSVTFSGVNRSGSIQIRGIHKAYTQVLIDGHALPDSDSSRNLDIDRFPASMIERIEIIRSPLASLPSNGAAGTVNIITKRELQRPNAPARGVSFDLGHLTSNGEQLAGSAWASGEKGRLRYSFGVEHRRRLVNESSRELAYSGSAATASGGYDEQQKRKFDETLVAARLEYKVSDRDRLALAPTFSHSDGKRDQHRYRYTNDHSRFNRIDDEQRRRKRENATVHADWMHEFTNRLSSQFSLEGQTGYEHTRRNELRTNLNSSGQPTGTPSPGTRNGDIDLKRVGSALVLNQTLNRHTWEFGTGTALDTRDEITARNGIVDEQRNYELQEQISHAYLSDRLPLFGPDQLTLGLRLESSTTKITDNLGTRFRHRATDFNPSAHYRYTTLGEALDLRLGLARTLRRPNLRDFTPTLSADNGTLSRPDTRGNPSLRPEKIWGIDVGADWYLPDERGLISLNLYARDFADKIEHTLSLDASRWVRTPRNAGDGQLYGAEIEARVSLANTGAALNGLTLFANATTMTSELRDPLTQQKRHFEDTPNAVSNVGFDYYLARWRSTLGLNLNTTWSYSQRIAQPTNTVGVVQTQDTAFSELHFLALSLKTRINAHWSLALSANNLLRPTDKRHLDTYDASGALLSTLRTREPSYTTYYLRTSYAW